MEKALSEQNSRKDGEVTVAVPLSLTDLATSLRTFIKLVNDIIELGAKGLSAYRQIKLKRAAASLNQLYFAPGGVAEPLQRLASGTGTKADVEAMRASLATSALEVDDALNQLNQTDFERLLREHYGLRALERLRKVTSVGQASKGVIRGGLYGLIDRFEKHDDLSTNEVVSCAGQFLIEIAELNQNLIAFHDEVLLARKS